MFGNIYDTKKVLVTGNSGFKGNWLTAWLLNLGAEVYGISKDVPTTPSMFDILKLKERIKYKEFDIRDVKKMIQCVMEIKPDFVFHLAAQPIVSISYKDPIQTISTNVLGTASVLEALRVSKCECNAIIITSDKCYDNVEWVWGYRETDRLGGVDPYSASKGAAELIVKTFYHSYFRNNQSNIGLVSARAGNVVGGGDWALDRIVPDCIRAWSEGQPVQIRNPQSTRPWQHVLEPLSGYLRAGQVLYKQPDISGEAYNFGPSAEQAYTVLEFLHKLSDYCQFNIEGEQFCINENSLFHEAGLLKLNCDKALHELQWTPTFKFEQTARFTAEWYDAFYNSKQDMYEFTLKQIDEYVHTAREIGNKWAK